MFLGNDALQFLFWHILTPYIYRIAPGHSNKAQLIRKLEQAVEHESFPLFKKLPAEIRQKFFKVSSHSFRQEFLRSSRS
jgi:hypothetical protein